MYGRRAEELENAKEAHLTTIKLLRWLKDGEVSLDDLEVSDTHWKLNRERGG